jgi:CHAT domain-containing protein
MMKFKIKWWLLLLVHVWSGIVCYAQIQVNARTHRPSRTDEAELRGLAKKYFVAVTEKNWELVESMISFLGPDMHDRVRILQKLLKSSPRIELTDLRIEKTYVLEFSEPGQPRKQPRARMEISVDITAIDAHTGQALAMFRNMRRDLECIKGTNKIFRTTESKPKDSSANKQWLLVADIPKLDEVIDSLKPDHSDDTIRMLAAQETAQTINAIVRGVKQRAVELSLKSGLHQGLGYFRIAHVLERISERQVQDKIDDDIQSDLAEAEEELKDWRDSLTNPETRRAIKYYPGWSLRQTGEIHARAGNYSKALEFYLAALEPDVWYSVNPAMPRMLYEEIGFAYAKQRDYARAIDYYNKQLELEQHESSTKKEVAYSVSKTLRMIGALHMLMGDYAKAIACYQRALNTLLESYKIAPRSKDSWWRGDLLECVNGIERVYVWQRDYESMIRASEHIADDLVARGLIEEASSVLTDLTVQLAKSRRLPEALESGRQLIKFIETHKDTLKDSEGLLTATQFMVGIFYLGAGVNDRAAQLLKQAEDKIATSVKDEDVEYFQTVFQLGVGMIYGVQGDASVLSDMALTVRSSRKRNSEVIWMNNGSVTTTLIRLGDWYEDIDDFEKAWECYQSAASFAANQPQYLVLIDRFREIGEEFETEGDAEKALTAYRLALQYAEQHCCSNALVPEDFYWADQREGFSDTPSTWPDHIVDEAVEKNREAKWRHYAHNDNSPGMILFKIGELQSHQKQYAQAIDSYRQGLAKSGFLTDEEFASIFSAMANVYRLLGDLPQAVTHAERAIAFNGSSGSIFFKLETNLALGQAYLASKDFDKAQSALEQAIKAVEDARIHTAGGGEERQYFLAEKLAVYHALIETFLKTGQVAKAFEIAESTKARVMLEILSEKQARIEDAMTAAELSHNHQLQLRQKFLAKQIQSETNTARRVELEKQLSKTRFQYKVFRMRTYASRSGLNKPKPFEPETSQYVASSLLNETTALLEFVVADDRVFLLVLTKTADGQVRIHPHILPIKKEDLSNRIKDFRALIERQSDNFRGVAFDLYNVLFKDAQPELAGKENLIIIPDGVLWNLPFQALQTPAQRYLIEESTVSYAPSLAALKLMNEKRSQLNSSRLKNAGRPRAVNRGVLLAVGNPTIARQAVRSTTQTKPCERRNALQLIPESEQEVNEISRLYAGENGTIKLLVRTAATEENIKQHIGRYEVVHVATHGILDNNDPLDSYIVLAKRGGRSSQYGSLSAREMMALKLQADLVVLSACETAQGRVGEGEGVIGMTWALAAAGTPRIVASQWQVNSCSTTDMMVEFHRQLKKRVSDSDSGMGAAEALRQASLALMNRDEYRHPFYWAGFIAVGDPR